ncbi:hypothetical protein PSQ19_06295 [Devosia algicola]|uniref:Carboxypeptidase regulatory-like domain-containing protein n=1 Tax=Devosia algicola TaxID=3026418 RepID=A0ABY7YRC1_9HYPH|nr:hypothetical protein [Devosia algicola]WDR03673.1 hypothetical protein PSQ19_06295 [Devosia algicola]
MSLRHCLAIVLLALASLVTASLPFPIAFAQESASDMPPLPRPRPQHAPGDTSTPQSEQVAPVPAPPPNTAATSAIDALTSTPQPVTLTASITADGAPIPDGLVWRVFDTKTDATGELALAAKSDVATAKIELPPGNYVVHVAYGRAQTSDTLTVKEGENTKVVVLGAGALRLNAAVDGDIAIPLDLLHFDLFTADSEADRTMVAQNLAPNDIVTLNSGTYHVVSYFGDVNAVVRADLRVEAGQLTDATLYHHASQVSFKLVSEAGGEAIADVDWTVKTADGATVFTDLGAFPSTVLEQGDYLVLAKQGDKVFNRAFEVLPGPAKEIEVLTTVY